MSFTLKDTNCYGAYSQFIFLHGFPTLAYRLYNTATGKFAGFLNTLYGKAIYKFGRSRNVDDEGKRVQYTASWRESKVYVNRNTTTATAVPAGEYKVVVAARRKLSQGVYPIDFEVYEVAVLKV